MTAPSLPTPATTAGRARIVELLSLADELPEVDELEEFLTDDDPAVRRAALAVLGENLPPGVELAMAAALGDADEGVRTAAYDGLRELREVIEPGPAFADGLSRHQASPHAATRAAVVRLQWEHRLGDLDGYRTALHDADPVVRREAVAGLVSLDATGALAASAADLDALVRLAVAQGLASVGDPAGSATLDLLAGDQDLRVRAAAIEGYGTLGCGPVSLAAVLAAIDDPAWEMRKAAAIALRTAAEGTAVPALLRLVRDAHMDVRRAAIQGLAAWATLGEVRHALEQATADPDADVRGYARLALG